MSKQRNEAFRNSCLTPVYQNAAYFFDSTEQIIQYHQGQTNLGRYGRYDSPNWLECEAAIATLDGYDNALIFSSGMNAIVTTLCTFLEQGDTILYTGKCYRKIRSFVTQVLPKWGIGVVPMEYGDRPGEGGQAIPEAMTNAKIAFVEMPSNPHLYLTDLAQIRAQIGPDALMVVDSTLATPYNLQPKRWGADLTLHSCSKYMGGHGDLIAGSVAGSEELIEKIRTYRNMMGGVLESQTAALLSRSLTTFAMRMEHFNGEGMKVAQFLETHPKIKRVFYTGLESHPHYGLAKKYLTGHGGLISFELAADGDETSKFVDALQVPFMGTNFGSSDAMVEQCSVFTYYNSTPAERESLEISDSLIRLSIGHGDSDALITDIDRALDIAL